MKLTAVLSEVFQGKTKMNYKEVIKVLESVASSKRSESWDNVGLLVEPIEMKNVENLMLTNDLTEGVLHEAESKNVNFILSYHPPIFSPLKRITQNHWKQRIAATCLKKSIAVYSPHTAYDWLDGGVNDWLISAFGIGKLVQPVTQSKMAPEHRYKVTFNENGPLAAVRDKINSSGISEQYLICEEIKTIFCKDQGLASVFDAIPAAMYPNVSVTKNEDVPIARTGIGRKVDVEKPLKLSELISNLKTMTGLTVVRLGVGINHSTADTLVKTGAVCAGSGNSVLKGVAGAVDVVVTGEMSHHDVLEFTQKGTTVILLEHSNSERGFLKQWLQPKLLELFGGKVSVCVSEEDKDPLQFY